MLAALLLAAAVLVPITGDDLRADAQTAPDGSRSHLTQDVVDREPLSGGGWRIVIEATLDSNAICHTLLFQCVVEPELNPTDLTLESVECLSPGWNQIQITLPIVGTLVDVCARFDHHRAGLDQKFRFTYTTPLDVGSVSETTKFFRFPEEYFFVRAEDTVTIDLAAEADVHVDCPDSVAIGTSNSCPLTVEAFSNVPTASVTFTPPAQFATAALTADTVPGDWDCSGGTTCTFIPGGGTLPIGEYSFTASFTVVGPAATVDACASVTTASTDIASDCDEVEVYEDDTDTFLEIEKTTTVTVVEPGAALAYTITVTNTGPNPASDVRVFETPPPLLDNAAIRRVSGDGTWTCASGATLECTAPTLASGGVATFTVDGTVSASAAAGAPIVNEVTAELANDPFGPDFPVRAGTIVTVAGATATATPIVADPTFTG